MPPEQDERLAYRINDYSLLSGLGRTTIYGLIRDGVLQTVRVRGRHLIQGRSGRALLGGSD